MKKILLLMLISALFIFVGCQKENDEEPIAVDKKVVLENEDLSSEYIYWHGRHHYLNNKEYFYNTATGFKVSFIGKKIAIDLSLEDKNSDIYFNLARDQEKLLDAEIIFLSKEKETLFIEFDEDKLHTVELVKRSEPQDGVTSLVKMITDGEFVRQEAIEAPHFLLIGASGISGNGSVGTPSEGRTTKNSSSLHSFGYLTAEKFGGSYEFVSNSGWGLAFGFNDASGKTNIEKAYHYVGINSKQKIVEEDYTKKAADIIIVNIGGNDYSAVINNATGFTKAKKIEEFQKAVLDFVLQLRVDHPNAHIFWTMTAGSINGKAADSVFILLEKEDQKFIHTTVIKGVGEAGPVGANNHASYQTHQVSADILAKAIEEFTNLKEKK